MEEERKKILQMLADGIITVEEANELFSALNTNDDGVNAEFLNDEDKAKQQKAKKVFNFNNINFKSEMVKFKEELIKAKEKIIEEKEKVNTEVIKEKLKNGIDKIDKSLEKIDKAIMKYADKILKKNNSEEE